ncbi:SDR family NAD(P)-dependent oxidoreductase [Mycobacterium sp. Aquia_213]|nr:SDR family NAD(P)-dependent oxidoreductase [Mycobacterium sp. Aquia_213]
MNNAGMSPVAPSLLETSETLFDKVIGVYPRGPTRLTALAATVMARTGGGSIVNISSPRSPSNMCKWVLPRVNLGEPLLSKPLLHWPTAVTPD